MVDAAVVGASVVRDAVVGNAVVGASVVVDAVVGIAVVEIAVLAVAVVVVAAVDDAGAALSPLHAARSAPIKAIARKERRPLIMRAWLQRVRSLGGSWQRPAIVSSP